MTEQLRRLRAGQAISGILSREHNAFCDAAEIVANSNLAGARVFGSPSNPTILDVKNDTGAERLVGEIFGITGIALDTIDRLVAVGDDPTFVDHWPGVIAVAITPSADGAVAKCVVSGMVRAVVNVLDTEVVTVDIVNGSGANFVSHLAGRGRLAIPAASTGSQNAWVLLGGSRQIDYTGVADGAITAGGTGTVDIDGFTAQSVTASLDKMHGSQGISTGKEVGIKWYDREQIWRVVHAECEG